MLQLLGFAMSLSMLAAGSSPTAVSTSPSEVRANPDHFDGHAVTLTGTITKLHERFSRAGNPYYTFDLSDGTRAVHVFSFGQAPCGRGQVTVRGTFQKGNRQAQYPFYNEVIATRVTCP